MHENKLKTAWIDVKKAYDSVGHDYLIKCIERLSMAPWIVKFLKSLIKRRKIQIMDGLEPILEKKIERGILQGDSLSPLLFVLCMDPLSRRLNSLYPKLEIEAENENENYLCNHLLFVDDLKLFAKDDTTLEAMMEETTSFFEIVGLEMNKEKSATNSTACQNEATLIGGAEGYKYLGITEDSCSRTKPETLVIIKQKMMGRVEKLCKTKLNAKNLFKAINEFAISPINYFTGVVEIEPEEYKKIDDEIRQILNKHGVHKQPACKERLYLPRSELERGLEKVEYKSEQMILQLKQTFEQTKSRSLRREAILKAEREGQTHLSVRGGCKTCTFLF